MDIMAATARMDQAWRRRQSKVVRREEALPSYEYAREKPARFTTSTSPEVETTITLHVSRIA